MSSELTAADRARRRNAVGVIQVASIARQLGISDPELSSILAMASPAELSTQLQGATAVGRLGCSPETVLRMSHLLGIWRGLVELFPKPATRGHWLRSPNTGRPFCGEAPLAVIIRDGAEGLSLVHAYLRGETA